MQKIKGINNSVPMGKRALWMCCGQLPALAPHAGKKTAPGEEPQCSPLCTGGTVHGRISISLSAK